MSMNLDSNVSFSTKSVHYQNKSDDENEEEDNKVISRSVSCPKVIESAKSMSDDEDHDEEKTKATNSVSYGSTAHYRAGYSTSLHNYLDSGVQTARDMKNRTKDKVNQAMEEVDRFAHKVWDGRWRVVSFFQLQEWQKDNEFLHHWHRPQIPSFKACLASIFRIHTETGNIWTHLLGVILFLGICVYYLCLPATQFINVWQEKVVFFLFFLGAVLCLLCSTLFHTLGCHSERVHKIFGKLDYSGIALMIMGSFVPWVYYSFYCDSEPKVVYMTSICVLGVATIGVSQYDKFNTSRFRSFRAVIFASLGLSGIIPAIHIAIKHGFMPSLTKGQLGWLYLMAVLYLTGAFLYAMRIPERYFPGKCDLVFQSHQIFHVLVVLAAVVHFHGISNLQKVRFLHGEQCMAGD